MLSPAARAARTAEPAPDLAPTAPAALAPVRVHGPGGMPRLPGHAVQAFAGPAGSAGNTYAATLPAQPAVQFCGGNPSCGCLHDEHDPRRLRPTVQRHSDGRAPAPADPDRVLAELGSGAPLPAPVAEEFGAAYRASLAHVEIHRDSPVPARHSALALTVGHHIAFAPGRYAPDTHDGRQLIGHELAHVVQQQGGTTGVDTAPGPASDTHERQADAAARAATTGGAVPALSAVTTPAPQHDNGPAQPQETYEEFKQRVFAKARERLDHNVVALGEWRGYLADLTDQQLRAQSISAVTMEYAVRAALSPQGQYRFERWASTDEPAEQAFRGAQLSPDAPYKELAGSFMGLLGSRAFGHWTGPTRAQQLQVLAGTLAKKDLPVSHFVPGDPRYAGYGDILTRFRTGQQGGCQTCHDINREWRRMMDEYGDPMPDPFVVRWESGQLSGANFEALSPAYRKALQDWRTASPSGSGGSAPVVQKKAVQGKEGDPTGGSAGLPARSAPVVPAVPARNTDLCGDLPAADAPSASSTFDPAKWGPGSAQVVESLRVLGTVMEPLGPRGYRIIPHRTFDELWSAGPNDLAALRQSILTSLDDRVTQYQKLKLDISLGLVDYQELCPIVDELLPTTNDAVKSRVVTEIQVHRAIETITAVLTTVVGLALLLMAFIFPPSVMLSGPVLALSLGTTLAGIAIGARDVRRGYQYGLGAGAGVYTAAQEASADSLRISGAIALVASAFGLASWMRTAGRLAGAAGTAANDAGALTRAAGAAGTPGDFAGVLPGTRAMDMGGGRVILWHPDFPSEFGVLTKQGLTHYSTASGVAKPVMFWPTSAVDAAAVAPQSASTGLMSLRPPAAPMSTGMPLLGQDATPLLGAGFSAPVIPGIDPARVIPLANGGGILIRGPLLTPPPPSRPLLPEISGSTLPPGDWVLDTLPNRVDIPGNMLPYAGSRAWNYSAGRWDLLKSPTAANVQPTLRIYTGPAGERSVLLDIPGETRSIHTDPLMTGGLLKRNYPMLPAAMTDPQTGGVLARSHLTPHFRSSADPTGLQSTADPINFVGHDRRYNTWVRRTLEGRLDDAHAPWQAIEVWTTPRSTSGGSPVVTEEIIIQLGPTGAPARAWRFPTTEGYYDGMHDIDRILGPRFQGGFEIPLHELPPTLRGGSPP